MFFVRRRYPVLLFAACISSLLLTACHREAAPAPAPKPIVSTLPAGTRVPAMLMRQLESGVDKEGADVPMLVTEDVKDASGNIVVKRGSPLQGKITWSRRADAWAGLSNRPARLRFKFLSVTTTDSQAVEVCADLTKPDEPYELNRSNTGKTDIATKVDTLAADQKNAAILQAVNDLFEKGDVGSLDQPEERQKLAEIADQLQMPELKTVVSQTGPGDVAYLLQTMRRGNTLATLGAATPQGQLGLLALNQMASLAGAVGNRLAGITKGRNIKAYIGTPVTAYVTRAVNITLAPR